MVDAMLIITAIIFAPLVLFMCFLILGYFVHPDDRSEAYFPKVVTVAGLFLAFGSVLVLPYDVQNSREGDVLGDGGLRMDVLWQIIYLSIAVFVVILIPFAFFFYESDTDPATKENCCDTQFWSAFWYTGAFFVVTVFALMMMYAFLHVAEVPVHRIAQSKTLLVDIGSSFPNSVAGCSAPSCLTNDFLWKIPVTFPVYVAAFLSFIGWWFFAVFAGVGLVALPLDLINEFRTRPTPLVYKDYFEQKKIIGERAARLVKIGNQLNKDMDEPNQSRKYRKVIKQTYKKFESAYYFLKQDYEILRISKEEKGGNPLWYVLKLILGCLCLIIALTWIIHIGIFVLPSEPVHPFLNQFFIDLENAGGGSFPLFGVIAFGLYAFFLIWAVVKGNFRFFAHCFCKLYPMELHNTMMNAFLFNTMLILLCSIPVVQFCVIAFPIYARFTSIDMLFGTQAQYLPFFTYFWTNNVFVYILLGFAFLTLVVLLACPRDRAAEIEARLDAVAAGEEDY